MSAEEEIRKTIARFPSSFDLKDWALMESALAKAAIVDYSDLRDGPPKEITAPEYAQASREALEALDTQHIAGKLVITVEGKRASVGASSMIFRMLDGVAFNTHARYQFGLSEDQDLVHEKPSKSLSNARLLANGLSLWPVARCRHQRTGHWQSSGTERQQW